MNIWPNTPLQQTNAPTIFARSDFLLVRSELNARVVSRPRTPRFPPSMSPSDLLRFMRSHRLAVQASCAPDHSVQAALVGIAVTDAFELVFDTLATTRKARNLRVSPQVAFVLGGWAAGDERTVQFEGVADEPHGAELERIKAGYFAAWPDGAARASWPDLTYFRVRPSWIRISDFNSAPPRIVEFSSEHLATAPANER